MESSVPHFPRTQAIACDVFKPPIPLLQEDSSTLPDLYNWNAIYNPDHPFSIYDDDGTIRTITCRSANEGVHRAAHYFDRHISVHCSQDPATPRVIAILANLDPITFALSLIGSLRAGLTALLISTRNAPDAIVHLLSKTGAKDVFLTPDPATKGLIDASIQQMRTDANDSPLTLFPMPMLEDIFPPGSHAVNPFPSRARNVDSPGLIFHSSGTGAYPKPILCSHRFLMQWSKIPWYGELDIAGTILAGQSLPVFHGFGFAQFCFAPTCGATIAIFRPKFPPIIPTPDSVFESIVTTKTNIAMCVPAFLEKWALDPKKVEHMIRMKGVIFGSGPLSKDVGDHLVSRGVCVGAAYGTTEGGGLSKIFPDNNGLDWEYIRLSDQLIYEMRPQGDGSFELVLIDGEGYRPMVINTKVGDRNAYATSDLLFPHPTKPGLWKIYGRADDQIMLSTGEKTNPGPIERVLTQDPRVQGAVMFGRGRFENGVLVDPKPDFVFDTADKVKLRDFRNAIWPTVEKANASAPQHSRIFKEMILVTSPAKPVQYTLKGLPRRQVILKQYEEEISGIYERVENILVDNQQVIQHWTPDIIRVFVRETVQGVMKQKIIDDDNFFQLGCDSLQATWIRLGILRALRTADPTAARSLDLNFVFQAPSITRLSYKVYNALHPSAPLGAVISDEKEILSLLDNYSTNFPSRPGNLRVREHDGDVILLTGTTGGFGCNILAQLSLDPTVKKVFAFNRPSENPVIRQFEAMKRQGLHEECLRSPKFCLVEGDISMPHFDLDPKQLEEIRGSITQIIHNAWPVDFSKTVSSFEGSIQGTRNLIDLALSSPWKDTPSIVFVSSVGVFQACSNSESVEEHLTDIKAVPRSGYSASKWIGERIFRKATEETGLRTMIVRPGQLCGDRNGNWNEKEWFPMIIKSALSVHCLPDVKGESLVSWIPSFDAAAALNEMRKSNEEVLHLVSPNLVPWRTFLEVFSKALGVPLVPYETWLKAMEDDLADPTRSEVEAMIHNPGLRLLPFYRHSKPNEDGEPLGLVRLDVTKAKQVAPSLNQVKMTSEWVDKWIGYWRSSGFLPPKESTGL